MRGGAGPARTWRDSGSALIAPAGARGRIAGRSAAATGERPNEQVIAEVDELRQRVAELEERQDFTERVLARQREQSQLDSGV